MNDTNTREILSDLIDLPANQMRRNIDRDELHVLAENIKANGLISPITVRPVGERYELVAGQRRLMALRIAGIIRVPCIVRDLNDITALNIMAAENIERRDVDLVDESNFIARVMKETNADVEQMAERLKRGEQYVKDRLLVAEMPDYMQAFLKTGEIKLGAAIALMEIEPDEKRKLWAGMAVDQSASVRVVEYWAYQHRLGVLPGTAMEAEVMPGAPAPEYKAIKFRCAVDGKEYLATECQSVFIFKGNVPLLEAFRAEMGKDSVPALG